MRTASIGLGANLPSKIGPPESTLAAAFARLEELDAITACSSLYSTAPVGFAGQPRFLNAVVTLETELTPFQLLGALLKIEREFGRDRLAAIPNGPRILDLDILLYEDFVIGGSSLVIPHERFQERAFVLVPLSEIAPRAIDPRTGSSVSQLLKQHEGLFPNSHDALDAVVRIKSDLWQPMAAGRPAATEWLKQSGYE
jgi:2-amino-4-hydroxy-6-hydroxymethyldihydropteridine diphosphokinase